MTWATSSGAWELGKGASKGLDKGLAAAYNEDDFDDFRNTERTKHMTKLVGEDQTAARVFRALGDPTRFQIVRMLLEREELGCGDFTAAFDLSASALSHHTRVLQECGLITMRKEGAHHFFRVNHGQVKRFAPHLASSAEPIQQAKG